jgi:phosphoribosylformylglycinamidine synthase
VIPSICVVQFPGVNCEYETAGALRQAGLGAAIVRWNSPAAVFTSFDGYVLPGGFSYQDRIRAGAVAAREDVIGVLSEESEKGKPILGICNGAQVLVESGLVPGFEVGRIDLALAPNKGMGRTGYYCSWVFVRVACRPERTAITRGLEPGEVMPIPVAHAEGRFTSSRPDLAGKLLNSDRVPLAYCRPDGTDTAGFPDDPNGSMLGAAAIASERGNVVAMMPHPERSTWLRQVPVDVEGPWPDRRLSATGHRDELEGDGPGIRLFRSLKIYIEEET